ncbi:hypothetical protein BRC2024_ULFKEANI_CDS_0059 [Acinetobacter phage vB_AbaM_Konradin-v2]
MIFKILALNFSIGIMYRIRAWETYIIIIKVL